MAFNEWIPSQLTLHAARIPIEDRIGFMVSKALKPIPEHKFGTIYSQLFNDAFSPRLFGKFANITELIASKPNVYRTLSNDGRAYIHYNNPFSNANDNIYKHTPPKWAIKAKNKTKMFGQMRIVFKIYKDNKCLKEFDLRDSLFAENGKSFVSFGRDNNCDFCIQHPSISRKHCIFQFGNDGSLFIYDTSTHGILLNHKNIPKKKYVECKSTDKIKFGHSQRMYHLYIIKHGKINKINEKSEIDSDFKENKSVFAEIQNQDLVSQNSKQQITIEEMQKRIENLTNDLKSAKKKARNESQKVASLMEEMECLKVTDSNRKRRVRKQRQLRSAKEVKFKFDISESENDKSDSESESESEGKRVSVIKGIDFVKEVNDLSSLTVVKLKYYSEKNKLNIGRVKKSELIKIIKKDIKNHFDV